METKRRASMTEASGPAAEPEAVADASAPVGTDIATNPERLRPNGRRRQPALLAFGLIGVVVGYVLVYSAPGGFFGVIGLLLMCVSIAVGAPEVIGTRQ
jgi:hypothetical protein